MPQTFEIGLVMAGAVSAGSYTGGAMDFLLQALDVWTIAKQTPGSTAPPHDVQIRVATGASAGGITTAILASSLSETIPPVDVTATEASRRENKFYDAWVNLVSIEELLNHRDLDRSAAAPVQSLLDSTVLDRIANRVFEPGTRGPQRPYIANPLVVSLTVTNLRGVPYQIQFQGDSGSPLPYVMNLHGDQLTFVVTRPAIAGGLEAITPPDKAIPLNAQEVGSGFWPLFQTTALATGAFPFGLAPRTLTQKASEYDNRIWYHPYPRTQNGNHECGFYAPLKSAMHVEPAFSYQFMCVDGGVIDNEPMGMAREHLHWNRPGHTNPNSAIIMIDPFPNADPFQEEYDFPHNFSILKMFPALVGALIGQSRFKPEELTRALDPNILNQLMIAPVRRAANGQPETYPIACGGLGGFAGFLSRDFRAHDFQLGRLNAQSFIRHHFVLPEEHSLFQDWSEPVKTLHRVTRDSQNRIVHHDANGNSFVFDVAGNPVSPVGPLRTFLPIIPLIDSVTQPESKPIWPQYTRRQLADLRARIEDRSKRVVERLIEKIDGGTTKFLLRRVWWAKRDGWIDAIMNERIVKDLRQRRLLTG